MSGTAIIYLVSLPVTGLLALGYQEKMFGFFEEVRLFFVHLFSRDEMRRLQERREAITHELKLYRQRKDHTFEPPRSLGWEGAGQISVGDYDNDGDEDILVGRSLARLPAEKRQALGQSCALLRNDVGNRNHWLSVVCVGKTANRDGIGCRIRVTTADGVTQTREIRGGLGHAGHNGPYIAHFGLGAHTRAARVEIRWPDRAGSRSVRVNVEADQRVTVAQ